MMYIGIGRQIPEIEDSKGNKDRAGIHGSRARRAERGSGHIPPSLPSQSRYLLAWPCSVLRLIGKKGGFRAVQASRPHRLQALWPSTERRERNRQNAPHGQSRETRELHCKSLRVAARSTYGQKWSLRQSTASAALWKSMASPRPAAPTPAAQVCQPAQTCLQEKTKINSAQQSGSSVSCAATKHCATSPNPDSDPGAGIVNAVGLWK